MSKWLFLISIVVVGVLFIFGRSKVDPKTVLSLQSLVSSGEAIGLDVRTDLELKINASPSAKHIALSDLDQKFQTLDPNKTILVFCESGARADRAIDFLKGKGFSKLQNIRDWRAWNEIQSNK